MRKYLLSMPLLLLSVFAFAQKGSLLIGGSIEFRKNNNIKFINPSSLTNGKNHSLEFSPYLGYQFGNKITGGATLSYISAKGETTTNAYYNETESIQSEQRTKDQSFAIGPFVRYTERISDIFVIFGQFEAQYMGGKNHRFSESYYLGESAYQNTAEAKSNGMRLRLFPAVFIDIKKGFGLNISIGGIEYQKYGLKDQNDKPESWGLTFGKSANIGISKNF